MLGQRFRITEAVEGRKHDQRWVSKRTAWNGDQDRIGGEEAVSGEPILQPRSRVVDEHVLQGSIGSGSNPIPSRISHVTFGDSLHLSVPQFLYL